MQRDPSPHEPVDPDVDLRHPAATPPSDADGGDAAGGSGEAAGRARGGEAGVLAAIAVGGAIGASARYLVGLAWPTPSGSLPWATMAINVIGCALIGVLMVLVSEVWIRQRLLRPFFGTGMLGGFTTFSTYAVDIQQLLANRHAVTAVIYLAATVLGALAAVWAGAQATRRVVTSRR